MTGQIALLKVMEKYYTSLIANRDLFRDYLTITDTIGGVFSNQDTADSIEVQQRKDTNQFALDFRF